MKPHISAVEILQSFVRHRSDGIRDFVRLNKILSNRTFFFMKHLNYNFSPAYNDFRANFMHVHVLLKDNGQTPKVIPVKFNVIIVQVSLVTLWCQVWMGRQTMDNMNLSDTQ